MPTMTPHPTAAAMRAANAIRESFVKAGFDPGDPTHAANVIDLTTHLPQLIACVKRVSALGNSIGQLTHVIAEADQLLNDVGE